MDENIRLHQEWTLGKASGEAVSSNSLLALCLRAAIANLESLTAQASNDLAMLGSWSFDYASAMSDMRQAITELTARITES